MSRPLMKPSLQMTPYEAPSTTNVQTPDNSQPTAHKQPSDDYRFADDAQPAHIYLQPCVVRAKNNPVWSTRPKPFKPGEENNSK